jgi:NAD(P)-dependent dehydrogenase (short-subunit alcohol dehydrogenase family)
VRRRAGRGRARGGARGGHGGGLAGRAERAGVSVAEVERQIGASISIGRIVTADEVASVVTFLASPKSVAINGDAISVGGGAIGPIYC